MAIRQPFRGDPETKQYYVVNDFSGGINTSSTEVKMRDNEFRNLQNVELTTKGEMSNRKGFAKLDNFYSLLSNAPIELSATITKIKLLKITVNKDNFLENCSKLSLEDFTAKYVRPYPDNTIVFQAFFAAQDETDPINPVIRFYIYAFWGSTSTGIAAVFERYIQKTTFETITGTTGLPTNNLLYGTLKDFDYLNTSQFVDKVYINTSDIFEPIDAYSTDADEFKGILVLDTDSNDSGSFDAWGSIDLLTRRTYFKPTPFEITNIGFNVLRENPLTDITTQGTGLISIQGTFLIDWVGRSLEKIIRSSDFSTLNVMYTGNDAFPCHFELSAVDQNDVVINNLSDMGSGLTTRDDVVITNDAYFSYNFDSDGNSTGNLGTPPITSVTFKFTKNINNVVETNSTSSMVVIAKETRPVIIYETGSLRTSAYQKTLLGNTYSIGDYTLKTVETGYANISALTTADPAVDGQIYYVDTDSYYVYTLSTDSYDLLFYYEIPDYRALDIEDKRLIFKYTDLAGNVIYSAWNYTFNYLATSDFITVPSPDDILDFQITYEVSTDTKFRTTIEPVSLEKAKFTQIQDRLAFYEGNTIYFSEQFQYDYVPNLNFVLLPIKASDEITTIYFFRGSYIIFTKESIWKMSGTIFGEDFQITKINDFVGCVAPYSVRALNNNLIFLSQHGLYYLTQSFYQEGLENVKRADEDIDGLITIDKEAFSFIYRDQYWLVSPEAGKTYKYYYDIPKTGGGHPFTIDVYAQAPEVLDIFSNSIYASKDGLLYAYGYGYTDFLPEVYTTLADYVPTMALETKDFDFGYPTHDKKVKNIFFKTISQFIIPMYLTIRLDGFDFRTPYEYTLTKDENGVLSYEQTIAPRYTVNPSTSYLGTLKELNFTLGQSKLGVSNDMQQHKIPVGGKAKNLKLVLEQKIDTDFRITNMGFVVKLGKVRGDI